MKTFEYTEKDADIWGVGVQVRGSRGRDSAYAQRLQIPRRHFDDIGRFD